MATEPHGQIAAAPPGRAGLAARPGSRSGPIRTGRVLRNESGTATVEFCLAFPIVLFLCLILVQSTLLMVGNQFVHYAAFAATRSAIVYIPQDYSASGGGGGSGGGEPRNTIIPEKGRAKYDAIRAAAYIAVAPVCGKLEESAEDLNVAEYVAGLRSYYTANGQDVPRWVETLAADRLRYAAENTDVQIMETVQTDDGVEFYDIAAAFDYYNFGPREAITVRVEHRLNLSVPYVRSFFADGELDDGRGKYSLVSAHYTLTNEGVNPELPGPPELPRVTD